MCWFLGCRCQYYCTGELNALIDVMCSFVRCCAAAKAGSNSTVLEGWCILIWYSSLAVCPAVERGDVGCEAATALLGVAVVGCVASGVVVISFLSGAC